jgi:ATP-binding cassette subfamily F protein uup
MSILLSCKSLSKTFGAKPLFDNVSMGVSEGERLGMIGPNGSGKSTLLKIIAGLETPDTGNITRKRDLRMGYVTQADTFPENRNVLDLIADVYMPRLHDEHEAHVLAEQLLSRIGFERFDQFPSELSGGWKKRLSIARELAKEPELLLMDEPTNHLDVEGILWLEDLLADASFGVVFVTHDRYFLESTATRVLELSRAYPEGTFTVEGPYSTFLERRQAFLDAQAKQEQALASQVRLDIAWLSRGAKARRTKAKSRIQDSFERMDQLADLKRRNAPNRAAAIEFGATGRATRELLVAKKVSKSLGGKPLFTDLDLVLAPGTCVGLLGPNGSGKTTLIKTLTGEIEPDSGTIKRADNLKVVLFTQHREALDPSTKLRDALCPVSDQVHYRGTFIHVHTWAEKFLFNKEQLKTSVGDLSGGEQARVLLARLMLQSADLLILDEPTNDLDIPSLEVLEQSLADFPGAVLLVTHDRFLLDRLSTLVLALDGRGNARTFADYPQWEANRGKYEIEEVGSGKAPGKQANAPVGNQPAPQEAAPAAPVKARRLSYKEQREWDQMEENIMNAEEEVSRLQALMNDPGVLADHKKLAEHCKSFDQANALVAKLYARWAELEEKQKG